MAPKSSFSAATAARVGSADVLQLTAQIAAAHLTYNKDVPTEHIPGLIQSIHRTLVAIQRGQAIDKFTKESIAGVNVPAVDPKFSVTDEYIVCLDCGGKFRDLTRHIILTHKLKPHEYLLRWNLPDHYPLQAPFYDMRRHEAAREWRQLKKEKEQENENG